LQADNHSVDSQTLLLREKRAIERAQGGDLAALDPVLAQHAEALFMCILGWLGERGQAEELLKETFATAIERISSYVWQERSIYRWLRQIALNKLLDHHRAAGRRKRLCQALRSELDNSAERAASALSAEEERRIAERRIEATLASLPPRYAQAIRLRLCNEQPRAICASALGVSTDSFDVQLLRAVTAFRKAYGGFDG